jgi:phenylalanyl-tRNA synthetase beta chain
MEMGNGVEMNMARIDAKGNTVDMSKVMVYKIEVPANRYDLLCCEGIATAIKCYLGKAKLPTYSLSKPAKMEKVIVKPSTK